MEGQVKEKLLQLIELKESEPLFSITAQIEIVQLSKLHNNANVLSIGARFVNQSRAEEIIDLWLSTSFEEGRHQRRIEKLDS